MGIRGLWTRLRKDYHDSIFNFVEIIPRGATLLVDANNFLFHLLDQQILTLYKRFAYPREYGGCYALIKEMFRLEIQRLRQKLGFTTLLFYFDGPLSYFKSVTKGKRQGQILEQWQLIYCLCAGQLKQSMVKPSQLPLPPLAIQTFRQVLDEMNITVISCEEEADQIMALDCSRLNSEREDGGTIAYCYSMDSDFLLMKDCPLVAIGSLDDEDVLTLHLKREGKIQDLSISTVVWRRSNIAQLYNCTEEQLLCWGILMGNDFTGQFEKRQFHDSLTDSHYSPEELLEWLKSSSSETKDAKETESPELVTSQVFTIESIQSELVRLHCLYSYRWYQLEDVSDLCTEEHLTQNHPEGMTSTEVEDGILLQSVHREQLQAWLQSIVGSKSTSEMMSPLLVIQFLEDCIITTENSSDPIRAVSAPAKTSDFSEADLSQLFTMEHLMILREMLKRLEQSKKQLLQFSYSLLPMAKQILMIRWENILAGNYFQLLLKEVDRWCRYEDMADRFIYDPALLYDGTLFHLLAYEQYEQTAKNLPATLADPSLSEAAPEPPKKPDELPIDQYREEILSRIHRSRVVVLSGETGCGKSTRVPIFIYENAKTLKKKCRIIICQPRRIACVNLKNRLQEKLGDVIGLRMGHGVREETSKTQIYFVTSGYLVRLLAHHPHALQSITHLIIDEVHERSVDNDLLCYLIKRNLSFYTNLHLILMSATVQTTLYQNYFNQASNETNIYVEDAISVGVRRFPVETIYVEALVTEKRFRKQAETIIASCQPTIDAFATGDLRRAQNVPLSLAKSQYDLCVNVIQKVGKFGTGILVFVSGMADILELQSRLEGAPGIPSVYTVVAIHSEIPFDEQLEALQPPTQQEIKVIIATNAAESSVTLPNVDIVICLGTHKALNTVSTGVDVAGDTGTQRKKKKEIERSVLSNVWISKSSAIQRAGRTGRIRPGKVYRLYPQPLYEQVFVEHELAEIHRKPLYEIILTLKSVFEDDLSAAKHNSLTTNQTSMKEILANLIETVPEEAVEAALHFLYHQQMITSSLDSPQTRLTSLGIFTASSSVDLTLSKLMIYGISLGIGFEAIVLAAALSQPKTLFRIAHPSIHRNPDEYNEIIRQTFLGSVLLDQENYSDAFAMLRLYILWNHLSYEEHKKIIFEYGIVSARIKHFVCAVRHLVARCKGANTGLQSSFDSERFLDQYYDPSRLPNDESPSLQEDTEETTKGTESQGELTAMKKIDSQKRKKVHQFSDYLRCVNIPSSVLAKLRLILLWTFPHNLIVSQGKAVDGTVYGGNGRELSLRKDRLPVSLPDFMKYFPHCQSRCVIRLIGKYHYNFTFKAPLAAMRSALTPNFQALVATMLKLWEESVFLAKYEQSQQSVGSDTSIKPNKRSSMDTNEKEKSSTTVNSSPLASNQLDRLEDLQQVTLITVLEDPSLASTGSKSKKGKKKSEEVFYRYQLAIAIIIHHGQPDSLIAVQKLLRGIISFLQAYQPQTAVHPYYFRNSTSSRHTTDTSSPDAEIAYIVVPELVLAANHMNMLYQTLNQYTGIIHVISEGPSLSNKPPIATSGNIMMSSSRTISQAKVTTVNWKPSRSCFTSYFSQWDRATVWSEDTTFHTCYEKVREEDIHYQILFPLKLFGDSSNTRDIVMGDYSFRDISENIRLFHAYCLGQKDRKMNVTDTSTASEAKTGSGNSGGSSSALVPGSLRWKQKKEQEQQELQKQKETGDESLFKKPELNINIQSILWKPQTTAWKVIGHLEDEQEDTSDELELVDFPSSNKTSLMRAPWYAANLSSRSGIASSSIHVERRETDPESGEIVKVSQEEVYGVCVSATISISATSGQQRILCEGITLFPSAAFTKWGLLARGFHLEEDTLKTDIPAKKRSDKKGNDLDDEDYDRKRLVCQAISDQLRQLKDYRIQPQSELMGFVEDLLGLLDH